MASDLAFSSIATPNLLAEQAGSSVPQVFWPWSHTCRDWARLITSDETNESLISQFIGALLNQEGIVRQMALQSLWLSPANSLKM
jgi:hypothetical protein